MTAREYDKFDRATIDGWAKKHGITLPATLPTRGWIVPDGAYMGLEQTGERAWLEPAIVDPDADRAHRWAALGACLHAAEYWARGMGITRLYAFTDVPTVARWAVNRGYMPAKGVLTSKELR